MIELESPQIEPVEEVGTYAKYEAGPLQAGYGVPLGNALRRVLLSSLEGAAVTSIQIRDVYQEFSTIPGVKEDVTQIVLNVKKLRLRSFATHPVSLRLIKSGAGPVLAPTTAEPPPAHQERRRAPPPRGHRRARPHRDRQPGPPPHAPGLGRCDDRDGYHGRAWRRLPAGRANRGPADRRDRRRW